MTAIVYLMALFGCGEGEAACQQLAVLETRYESRADCVAATEAAVASSINDDYPILVAQCYEAGARPVVRSQDVLATFRS